MTFWIEDLGDWLLTTVQYDAPDDVLQAARRCTLDSVACALGASGHPATTAMRQAIDVIGGRPTCSVIGSGDRLSIHGAILANGTLIRALDCNDMFVVDGRLRGHPSDNIAVAIAFAEWQHAAGSNYLRAVATGYELYWRLQQHLLGTARRYHFDHVSASGFVAAAIGGLLLGLDCRRLSHAMAIGGAQTLSLSQLRHGQISMLKASANALAASTGATAALLAANGFTGPRAVLEGDHGLLAAFGLDTDDRTRTSLTRPVDRWHILDVHLKKFPAVGTSQAAIAAAIDLATTYDLRPDDIEQVTVRLSDTETNRRQALDRHRRVPESPETADHSICFLTAAALIDRELSIRQFTKERWSDTAVRKLMDRITVTADILLGPGRNHYPAIVTIVTRTGPTVHREILTPPGSPENPLSGEDIRHKLEGLHPTAEAMPSRVSNAVMDISGGDDFANVAALFATSQALNH